MSEGSLLEPGGGKGPRWVPPTPDCPSGLYCAPLCRHHLAPGENSS